jgi:hypothetical protein
MCICCEATHILRRLSGSSKGKGPSGNSRVDGQVPEKFGLFISPFPVMPCLFQLCF